MVRRSNGDTSATQRKGCDRFGGAVLHYGAHRLVVDLAGLWGPLPAWEWHPLSPPGGVRGSRGPDFWGETERAFNEGCPCPSVGEKRKPRKRQLVKVVAAQR